MSNLFGQFCMCGVQAAYPHAAECPYPLYQGSCQQEEAWLSALRARLATLEGN